MFRRTGAERMAAAAVAAGVSLSASAAGAPPAVVGLIEIEGTPAERRSPFAWLEAEAPPTLQQLVEALEGAAERSDLDAVVIRLKEASLGQTQVEELGAALDRVREAGKHVSLYAYSHGTRSIQLGAHADEIIVQEGGAVSLPGMHLEEMYLAGTLDWLGMEPDFVQIGDYKGASEPIARTEPSPEWDLNIDQLLDSLYGNVVAEIAEGRGLSRGELQTAMQDAWLADAERAIELGLIDAAVDLPKLDGHLADVLGEPEVEWRQDLVDTGDAAIDSSNPFAMFQFLMSKPEYAPDRDTIAVVHIDGPIVDGDSTPAGLFGSGNVGSTTIRRILEELRKEELIRGVIVRVNSPGGSAIASEVIWQGLRRVAAEKPVWTSVGAMAASGGYYVAVGGERIYANPSSIVGSIGVVGGKIAMGGTYEKLRINVVERSRGPMAGLFASTRPWNEEERELIARRMTEVYDLFTERVSQARSGIDLSKTAEGRLFTGDKAIGLRMVDRLGGLDAAIEDMASELGLVQYDVMDYPGPKGLDELFKDIFPMAGGRTLPGGGALGEKVAALREVVGPAAWPQVRAALEAMAQFREEPVQLVLPRALIVR